VEVQTHQLSIVGRRLQVSGLR